MTEYVAFLRGINAGGHGAVTMEDLKKAFEACGFKDVKTIATSGNVAFSSAMAEAAIVKRAEAALKKRLGRETPADVRSRDELRKMVQTDPYKGFAIPKNAKRIVTFLDASAKTALKTPISSGRRPHPAHQGRRGLQRLRPESQRRGVHEDSRAGFRQRHRRSITELEARKYQRRHRSDQRQLHFSVVFAVIVAETPSLSAQEPLERDAFP